MDLSKVGSQVAKREAGQGNLSSVHLPKNTLGFAPRISGKGFAKFSLVLMDLMEQARQGSWVGGAVFYAVAKSKRHLRCLPNKVPDQHRRGE